MRVCISVHYCAFPENHRINLAADRAWCIFYLFNITRSTLQTLQVGRDPRLSGPMLEAALTAGLLAGGAAQVHSFALSTTPAMFSSIVATDTYQVRRRTPLLCFCHGLVCWGTAIHARDSWTVVSLHLASDHSQMTCIFVWGSGRQGWDSQGNSCSPVD